MGIDTPIPTLTDLTVDTIASEIDSVVSLCGVPEELVLAIFQVS
jgi:hypothetical protein